MKLRKIISIMCILALVVAAFAGCGGNSGNTGGSTGGSTGGDTQTGDEGETIKIGLLGPYTGAVAEYGLAVRDGALMYIDEVNAAGGINGKQIETFYYDDEHDQIKALTGYNFLVDQGVTAIIGGVTSGPTMAVVPEGFNDNMPMITASATADGVTYDAENDIIFTNMFRSCFIDPFQGEKMADFAKNVIKAETGAVIFNTGVDYSIGLKDAFLAKAEAIGLKIVANEAYGSDAVDFQSQLTNIAAADPDVLFVPDYYQVVALLSGQARNAGVRAALLGADGWDTVVDIMTDRAPVEGSYYCSGYTSEDETPMVQEFLKNYVNKYGSEPNMFAAQGYDAAMILVAAITVAEKGNNEHASDAYRTSIINALKATNLEGVTGHITYDKFNNPIKSAVIIEIKDGAAKFWGKY